MFHINLYVMICDMKDIFNEKDKPCYWLSYNFVCIVSYEFVFSKFL